MFWPIERLRRIFVGVTRGGSVWNRLVQRKTRSKALQNNTSERTTANTTHSALKKIRFGKNSAGGRRIVRRKYEKLRTEIMLDDCSINARNNNESKLTIQQEGLVMTDLNDITSSEASETETDPDDAEALTCNVCDRAFLSTHLLLAHQQKRRHYGCSACESVFQTMAALEQHKEEYEHWSDDDSQDMEDSDDDSDDSQLEENNRLSAVGIVIDEELGLNHGVTAEKERLL